MGRLLAVLVFAFAVATSASAQPPGRLLPAGKLGELTGRQHAFPLVQIAGEVRRLSPGALVFDQDNRTILHGQLPESANVLYVEGPGKEITRIYILHPNELESLRRAARR